MSAASEEEGNTKRQVAELEALRENLETILDKLPGKLSAKRAELDNAETAVWKAKTAALLRAVRELPHFDQVTRGSLQTAYAAWGKAGMSYQPRLFLEAAGHLNLEPPQIKARQVELSEALGFETVSRDDLALIEEKVIRLD